MNFGIHKGPGTHPPQIPVDDCILLTKAIIVHFQKIIFKKRLPILERKFTFRILRVLIYQPYYEGETALRFKFF